MELTEVLATLQRQGTASNRAAMARYGIVAKKAYGVQMGGLLKLAKSIGPDHDLAIALWRSQWYEARLLAALVGEPERVTVREMNAWARSFENWADCDTVCFKLWDRTPLAWGRAQAWASARDELVKRGGLVLMACLALHDKTEGDKAFLPLLALLEKVAGDERHLVQKANSWALRSIAGRSRGLHAATLAVATRLAQAVAAPPRAIGKEALRDLRNPKLLARIARQKTPPTGRG